MISIEYHSRLQISKIHLSWSRSKLNINENKSFNLKINYIDYTLSSDGHRYKYWNVAVMFLENLGPKTSLSVPNWWRDCRTIESITYNPGTLYSGLHYKDKDVKSIQESNLTHIYLPSMKLYTSESFYEKLLAWLAVFTASLSNAQSLQSCYFLGTSDPVPYFSLMPSLPPTTASQIIISHQALHTNPIHPAQEINFTFKIAQR